MSLLAVLTIISLWTSIAASLVSKRDPVVRPVVCEIDAGGTKAITLKPPHNSIEGKILIHYHIQHMAGTTMWSKAMQNNECAPRACLQSHGHCFHSISEEVEADHLLSNANTYISYEAPLPAEFPLPFVNSGIRSQFFFTTIMRDPIGRLLSSTTSNSRGGHYPEAARDPSRTPEFSAFLLDYMSKINPPYKADNLAIRWMAGINDNQDPWHLAEITSQHLQLAKCRLDLFDLVMTQDWFDEMQTIFCNTQHWRWKFCSKHASKPRNYRQTIGSDAVYAVMIERNRPSFELFDYARSLAAKHMVHYGVRSEAPVFAKSSYFEFLSELIPPSNHAQTMSGEAADYKESKSFQSHHRSRCEAIYAEWGRNTHKRPMLWGGVQ